jgi:hypothetical protein
MNDSEMVECGIHLTGLAFSLDRDFYECTSCFGEGLVYPSKSVIGAGVRCPSCLGSGVSAIPFGEFA